MPRVVEFALCHPWRAFGAVVGAGAVLGSAVGAALEFGFSHARARRRRVA